MLRKIKCWLFGHKWIHATYLYVNGKILADCKVCDRCWKNKDN